MAVDPDLGEGPSTLVDVFRAHHGSLVRTAYLLLGDIRDAEEAVQEAYFRVERATQRARSVDVALPYVRTAVLNVCRSGLRRRLVARRRPAAPAPDAPPPDEQVVVRDERRAVVAAVRALPGRQRECLVLRFYLDLSESAIADTLGISIGSVKTHVHRGMTALGELLEER